MLHTRLQANPVVQDYQRPAVAVWDLKFMQITEET